MIWSSKYEDDFQYFDKKAEKIILTLLRLIIALKINVIVQNSKVYLPDNWSHLNIRSS